MAGPPLPDPAPGNGSGSGSGRRRRVPAAAPAPVEYRDGVHLVGTLLWFDAARVRDLSFLSHARAAGSRRHRQVVTTAETAHLAGLAPETVLVARPERPFSVGRLRLELVGSGHLLGSASLLVDHEGRRLCYAGDLNPAPSPVASRFVQRSCDTLVLPCRFGHPRYRFPPRDELLAGVDAFVARATAEGRVAVLLVPELGLAQELAQRLGTAPWASRRIALASARYRELGIALPDVRVWRGRGRPGDVLLWPVGAPAPRGLPEAARRTLLLGGNAGDPGAARALGADAALPLSDHADHGQLVEYALASGARACFLLGPDAGALAPVLRARGVDARPLGPPTQMDLFRG